MPDASHDPTATGGSPPRTSRSSGRPAATSHQGPPTPLASNGKTRPSTATLALAAAGSAAMLVPLFTAAVRRAHDRGWDAWWLVGRMGTCAILVLMGVLVIMTARSDDGQAEYGSAVVPMGVAGVVRVVIGLATARKGDPGPNRCGDPR